MDAVVREEQHPEESPEPMHQVRLAHNLLASVEDVVNGEESIPGEVFTGVAMAVGALLRKALKDAGRSRFVDDVDPT